MQDAGYEASTEWLDATEVAEHKAALASKLNDIVYTSAVVLQIEKMKIFRLAYFCEHILPRDPSSPTCSSEILLDCQQHGL